MATPSLHTIAATVPSPYLFHAAGAISTAGTAYVTCDACKHAIHEARVARFLLLERERIELDQLGQLAAFNHENPEFAKETA